MSGGQSNGTRATPDSFASDAADARPGAGRVAALVLAAGLSSRMGRFKPLLELGGRTLLERVATLFRRAGVEDVRVVTGFRRHELLPELARLGLRAVVNERFEEGMFSSIRAGAADLADCAARGECVEALFLLPVDIPLVRPSTVRRLLAAWNERPDPRRILLPSFLGEPGHPPLVGAGHLASILAWSGEGGLRGYLLGGDAVLEPVETADEGALFDLDEPADCLRLGARCARMDGADVPSPRECRALLRLRGADERLRAHSGLVARLAVRLGAALARKGHALDLELLAAAGLLHDVAKGEPDHAQAGARLLAELGFPALGEVVAGHMDFDPTGSRPETSPITEAELLFLADKYAAGDRLVPVEERFRAKAARFADDPEAMAALERRKGRALRARRRVEKALGAPPEELLPESILSPLELSLDAATETDSRAGAWPASEAGRATPGVREP